MNADVRHDVTSHGSVSERIYLGLRQEIMHCEIAPGATLDAASIARRYEVSKTPVRDAMQKLAADGLVTILPRSGYRVAPITCLLYTSPSPRDLSTSRMPSSA